jgi:hypothetical protein
MSDAQSILEAWRQERLGVRRWTMDSPADVVGDQFRLTLWQKDTYPACVMEHDTSATVAAQRAIQQMEGMQ